MAHNSAWMCSTQTHKAPTLAFLVMCLNGDVGTCKYPCSVM